MIDAHRAQVEDFTGTAVPGAAGLAFQQANHFFGAQAWLVLQKGTQAGQFRREVMSLTADGRLPGESPAQRTGQEADILRQPLRDLAPKSVIRVVAPAQPGLADLYFFEDVSGIMEAGKVIEMALGKRDHVQHAAGHCADILGHPAHVAGVGLYPHHHTAVDQDKKRTALAGRQAQQETIPQGWQAVHAHRGAGNGRGWACGCGRLGAHSRSSPMGRPCDIRRASSRRRSLSTRLPMARRTSPLSRSTSKVQPP